ncbi:MAG TPA: hypothetical protein VEC19_19520 [Usitatibacter sp.]|nr:hypothetical protein [Usitatibacter sp.]
MIPPEFLYNRALAKFLLHRSMDGRPEKQSRKGKKKMKSAYLVSAVVALGLVACGEEAPKTPPAKPAPKVEAPKPAEAPATAAAPATPAADTTTAAAPASAAPAATPAPAAEPKKDEAKK